MKHFMVYLFGMMLSLTVLAEEEPAPPPLDPSFQGTHGMVLAVAGQNLFAINEVTFERPSNAQVVYSLSTKTPTLFYLVRDADLVTVKTQPFNLERLIRGEEEVIVKGNVYMGHYDRGGMVTFEDVELVFQKKLFSRDLAKEKLFPSSNSRVYESVPVGRKNRILLHKIQQAPSYQHLILFYEQVGCVTNFMSSSAIPPEGEVLSRLSLCGSMKPLYYSADKLN